MTQGDGIPETRTASPGNRLKTPDHRPASSAFGWSRPTAAIAAALLAALAAVAYILHIQGHPALALSIVFGAIFGVVLQRSRFCFFCMFRDWYDKDDPRGLFGLLVALATGIAGYTLIFGAWLPDAATGRLPPDAFIGPVSVALVAAGFAFGAGMAISGSCVSAHLYRLGEGSPTAPFALLGTVAGFILGFATWNNIYLAAVADAPVLWLPQTLGYAGALIATLVVLAVIAWALSRTSRTVALSSSPASNFPVALLVTRWPAWIGGAIIGALGTVAYFRIAPLGVTAEIGSRARQVASGLGVAPPRLEGLDTLRGCISVAGDALFSRNGAFILALVVASFAAALAAGQFAPAWPRPAQIVRGFAGGILLGWGAMTGLGCTVGTLLSGIMAGALSGWVFAAAVFIGIAVKLSAGRHTGLLPRP
ncbi:YeeE/YedE family protein [Bradyrhizobium sp. G127]|uniref:YeeE/YedE family protein n=1 Tax=Bradyrhizobium sp. G127 TaxID=2904800 RepID=UPI001F2BA1ED|nr:YeeE/YedE family protein [Bradyrhizobium sp. G127]